ALVHFERISCTDVGIIGTQGSSPDIDPARFTDKGRTVGRVMAPHIFHPLAAFVYDLLPKDQTRLAHLNTHPALNAKWTAEQPCGQHDLRYFVAYLSNLIIPGHHGCFAVKVKLDAFVNARPTAAWEDLLPATPIGFEPGSRGLECR